MTHGLETLAHEKGFPEGEVRAITLICWFHLLWSLAFNRQSPEEPCAVAPSPPPLPCPHATKQREDVPVAASSTLASISLPLFVLFKAFWAFSSLIPPSRHITLQHWYFLSLHQRPPINSDFQLCVSVSWPLTATHFRTHQEKQVNHQSSPP